MSYHEQSKVLSVLQPELLPVEELVQIIQSRCCGAENLRLMAKEGLVDLFRRVVLPLPQRLYRTNRRGKMLTARRARAGLGSERKDEGSLSGSNGRLKPPPDVIRDSHELGAGGGRNGETSRGRSGDAGDAGDAAAMKDRRRPSSSEGGEAKTPRCESLSGRRIALKRQPSSAEKPSSGAPPPPSDSKRQRTAIRWP